MHSTSGVGKVVTLSVIRFMPESPNVLVASNTNLGLHVI